MVSHLKALNTICVKGPKILNANRFLIVKNSFVISLLLSIPFTGRAQLPLFDSVSFDQRIRFVYPSTANNPYLDTLRYLFAGRATADSKPVNRLSHVFDAVQWTHKLWRHNGNNEPSANDALTIIREAGRGKSFRCVEYARVLTDVLLAQGYKARVLAIKTKNAEHSTTGAGHVLTEVWLDSLDKWVVADAQFNAVPLAGGHPLNAVELMQLLQQNRPVVFHNKNGPLPDTEGIIYRFFISPYLYFFDTEFDQRMIRYRDKFKIDTFSSLMLGPVGTTKPKLFQQRFSLNYILYTHSLRDFYRKPD